MCWKEKIQWQSVTNGLGKDHVLRLPFLDSYPQKVVLHSITARFSLRPYDFVISHPILEHLSRDFEKTTITAVYHEQIRCFPYVELSDVPRL
jgi:hypothetical protein